MRLMNMNESGRRSMSLRDAVYVGIISFLTPMAAQHNGISIDFNKDDNVPAQVVIEENPITNVLVEIEKLFEQMQSVPITNDVEMSIMWLDSPVTQEWEYDYQKEFWITKRDKRESLRSPPSIRIGLREDGVVIWKKINVQ